MTVTKNSLTLDFILLLFVWQQTTHKTAFIVTSNFEIVQHKKPVACYHIIIILKVLHVSAVVIILFYFFCSLYFQDDGQNKVVVHNTTCAMIIMELLSCDNWIVHICTIVPQHYMLFVHINGTIVIIRHYVLWLTDNPNQTFCLSVHCRIVFL